jgi:ornithine cyclodeaminase/alanine dehydrogenase-like protein (mu-crystallin family)
MLLLDHKDLEGGLDMAEAVRLVEDAHRAWGLDPSLNHPRRMLDVVHPEENRRVRLNSFLGAWPNGGYMGAQLQMHLPVRQEDQTGQVPQPTDVYALYDSGDGALLALFYGGEVRQRKGGFRDTALVAQRPNFGEVATAAIGAVGTKALAREDASTLGFFGTGSFAPGHLMAVASVRRFDTIKVYSRTPEHREHFCQQMSDIMEQEIISVGSPQECVSGSDVVMCVTNSDRPVLNGDDLKSGAHVTSDRKSVV